MGMLLVPPPILSGLTGTPDITVNNITGVAATFTGVLTYEDVTNVDSIGVVTARSGVKFGVAGAGGTVTADGHAEFAGIVTASSYRGDGSQLTGISVGISTVSSSPSANTVVTLNLGTAQHHDITLSAGITTITCTGGSFERVTFTCIDSTIIRYYNRRIQYILLIPIWC